MEPKPVPLLILLMFLSYSAHAQPTNSQSFEGTVTIDGEDAAIGTVIEAYIQGDDDPDVADGTTTLDSPGMYELTVEGADSYFGNTIIFKIDEVTANQTSEFITAGPLVSLDLTVGEGGSPGTTTTTTTTTTIMTPGECPVKGDAMPCDGDVSDFELLEYITTWVNGSVGDFDLLEAISNWAS